MESGILAVAIILAWILACAVGFVVYFIPSIIAYRNKHPHFAPIFIINFFLGFTLIGWIGSLVWSLMPPKPEYPQYPQYPNYPHGNYR